MIKVSLLDRGDSDSGTAQPSSPTSRPSTFLPGIFERGPICIDDVSLTVIAHSKRAISVSIVAFTSAHTTVLETAIGDPVNREPTS